MANLLKSTLVNVTSHYRGLRPKFGKEEFKVMRDLLRREQTQLKESLVVDPSKLPEFNEVKCMVLSVAQALMHPGETTLSSKHIPH